MSKQSKAKETQGYVTVPRGCGTCAHFRSDYVLPAWMAEHNADIDSGKLMLTTRYDINNTSHRQEVKLRCDIGGFAVRKTASCNLYEVKIT